MTSEERGQGDRRRRRRQSPRRRGTPNSSRPCGPRSWTRSGRSRRPSPLQPHSTPSRTRRTAANSRQAFREASSFGLGTFFMRTSAPTPYDLNARMLDFTQAASDCPDDLSRGIPTSRSARTTSPTWQSSRPRRTHSPDAHDGAQILMDLKQFRLASSRFSIEPRPSSLRQPGDLI